MFIDDKYPWYLDLWYDIEWYIWYKPRNFFIDVNTFFKNVWLFRKQLWNWRSFDSKYQTELFAFGLEQLSKYIKNGPEEEISAMKKVNAINELVKELKRDIDDEFVFHRDTETVEEFSKKYQSARNERFDKIARIIKGQDPFEFVYTEKYKNSNGGYKEWVEYFDGTGIDNWW